MQRMKEMEKFMQGELKLLGERNPSLARKIADEMKVKKRMADVTWQWHRFFLNNFHERFPREEDEGEYRELAKQSGTMDRIPTSAWSKAKKGQTKRAFYATLDRTLDESGIQKEELAKKLSRIPAVIEYGEAKGDLKKIAASFEARRAAYDKIFKTLFPVYLKLREKGYTHDDLTV